LAVLGDDAVPREREEMRHDDDAVGWLCAVDGYAVPREREEMRHDDDAVGWLCAVDGYRVERTAAQSVTARLNPFSFPPSVTLSSRMRLP
jgi:hypothetical protein